MMVELSPGEVVDRLTILEIKLARIADPAVRSHVAYEYEKLSAAFSAAPPLEDLVPLRAALKAVNEALWLVEDDLRDHERRQDFGSGFVDLARSVYRYNDRRSALKRQICEIAGSPLVDVKFYSAY